MIKGIVKIDNKDYKYKLKVFKYGNNNTPLGFVNISYKHNSVFYRDIECYHSEFLETIYNILDNFTKDEMDRFIVGYIKEDVEHRNREKKYR